MSHNIPHNVVSNGSIIPFIPFHVVEHILLNLDAQTLFRCAFLCRDWHSLITSTDFISRYSDQAYDSRNKGLLLKIFHPKEGKKSVRRRLCYSLHCDNDQFDCFGMLESPQIGLVAKKTLVGTSNGLVCLADNRLHDFILWNPTVRRYVLLPRILTSSSQVATVGFGFDRRNNDFKVVKFVEHKYDNLHTIWAFSYDTWSWKKITDSTPPTCRVEYQPHVLINGVLHWVAWHLDGHYNFILTFDLTNEVFGEILLPESAADTMDSISLATAGDSLAVLHNDQMDWSVWVMKKHDGVELWTNVVNVPNQAGIIPIEVLAICKNNDLILKMYNGQIRRYNPSTTTMNAIGVTTKGVKEGGALFRYYEESLYLLENREDVKYYEY